MNDKDYEQLQIVFNQIATLIPTLQGWSSVEKNMEFAALVVEHKPKVAVEIGVFGGRSLISIALAMRAVGVGKIMGIDPWRSDESVKGMDGANLEWWAKLDHDAIFRGCLQAVKTWNVTDQVLIARQRSDDVDPPPEIGLLIVDGNHGPQSIRDVGRFAPSVPVGGWVYLDDLDWSGGAVRHAEQNLIRMGFEFMRRRDEGAFYQRYTKPKTA